MPDSDAKPVTPLWLHLLAVLTVVVTLPLLFLGAEVTTKDAGMSDPVGFRTPWEITRLLSDPVELKLQLEYNHRLVGFVVGSCAIVLCVGLWLGARQRPIAVLGTLALVLICVQGLLGIFRVDLDARFGHNLALVHGAFAQIVIATLVTLAVVTSRGWARDPVDSASFPPALRRASLILVVVMFAQVLLGGVLRHFDLVRIGVRGHLLGAFAVVAVVMWVTSLYMRMDVATRRSLGRTIAVLHALVLAQILIGIETFTFKFFGPYGGTGQDWTRSLHYVVGAFLFATTVVLAVKTNRRAVAVVLPMGMRRLEGAL